jgi:hypothetical protein
MVVSGKYGLASLTPHAVTPTGPRGWNLTVVDYWFQNPIASRDSSTVPGTQSVDVDQYSSLKY